MKYNHKKFRFISSLNLCLLLLCMLFLTACAMPTLTPLPKPTSSQISKTMPSAVPILLEFWVTEVEDTALLRTQISKFESKHQVNVMVTAFQEADYMAAVQEAVNLGTAPDIVRLLNRRNISLLRPSLHPLNSFIKDTHINFLEGAQKSTTINKQRYGLSWYRFLCISDYVNLSILEKTEYPEAAFALIQFLTQSEQQVQNFHENTWYPTRTSVNEQLTGCSAESSHLATIGVQLRESTPTSTIGGASPDEGVEEGLLPDEIEIRQLKLEAALKEAGLMSDELAFDLKSPAAIVASDEEEISAAQSTFDTGKIRAVALPVINTSRTASEVEFFDLLTKGVIVGALSIDNESYGIQWQTDDPQNPESVQISLINIDNEKEKVDYIVGDLYGEAVDESIKIGFPSPFTNFAEGSRRGCWYWWRICGCVTIGRD